MSGLNLYAARSRWLEHLDRDRRLAKTTLKTYASVTHLALQGLPDNPTEVEIRTAIDRRLNHPSGHVRRQAFSALILFFAWWQKQGGPTNQLAEAKPPPKPKARRSALQAADLEALERRLPRARSKDRAEVLLMLRAGFRVGDVLSLTIDDIDFDQGRIRCHNGKGGTDTWLPMADSITAALREHLDKSSITIGLVFVGPKGRMTNEAVRSAWKRVAGPELGHFAAHQLRNTFADQMVRGGTKLNTVRKLMRHASLATTQRYLDDDEEGERDAIRALDGLTPADPRPRPAAAPPPPESRWIPPEPRAESELESAWEEPDPPPPPTSDLASLKHSSDLRFILQGHAHQQKEGWPALYRWLLRRLEADPQMASKPIWLTPLERFAARKDVPILVHSQPPHRWALWDAVALIEATWGGLLGVAADVERRRIATIGGRATSTSTAQLVVLAD